MVFLTLSQVSAVGFCAATAEVFVGQHEVAGISDCAHDDEGHLPRDCSDGPEPCKDSHLEIDLDVDDYVRTSTESEHSSPDFLPVTIVAIPTQKNLHPRKQILSLDFARPPPGLPVFLRFGVMRL